MGTRYQNLAANDPASITYLKWVQLDTPMMLIIVVLLTTLIVGLGTAFLGLAYHHERRHYERHRDGGIVQPLALEAYEKVSTGVPWDPPAKPEGSEKERMPCSGGPSSSPSSRLIAGVLGFGGLQGDFAYIAKILLFVFVVLFVVSLIFGRGASPSSSTSASPAPREPMGDGGKWAHRPEAPKAADYPCKGARASAGWRRASCPFAIVSAREPLRLARAATVPAASASRSTEPGSGTAENEPAMSKWNESRVPPAIDAAGVTLVNPNESAIGRLRLRIRSE